jgi:hypothetical protein
MTFAPQNAARSWAIGRLDRRVAWTLGFAAILAFYLATTPGNRFESMDGYVYAYDTQTRALTDLYDTRLLLYHVLMRLLYRAAHAIDDGVSAHGVLLMVSALSASLCLVLFARLLERHFALSRTTALLGMGFLGATYGFWRYSAEAEVYAPSLFLIMAVLSLVFAVEERPFEANRWTAVVPAAALAGFAVLFYQPNAIPLFLALPVIFLYRNGFPRMIAYGAIGGSVVLVGYVIAFLVDGGRPLDVENLSSFVFSRFGEFAPASALLPAIAKSILALGHVIVSGNSIFGLQDIAAALYRVDPVDFYQERVFAASHVGAPVVYLPLLTLLIIMTLGVYTVLIAVRARRRPLFDRRLAFALAWFGLYALVVAGSSPGNYEAWTTTLPPLVILFAAFVVEPCVRAGQRTAPVALLAALVLHNAVGGIGMVYGTSGDYYRAKGAWLLQNATADDLVILSTDGGMRSFLCYAGGLHAVLMSDRWGCVRRKEEDIPALVEATRRRGGRLFTFDDFFEPPAWRPYREHERHPEITALIESLRGTGRPVFQSDAGTTYQLP